MCIHCRRSPMTNGLYCEECWQAARARAREASACSCHAVNAGKSRSVKLARLAPDLVALDWCPNGTCTVHNWTPQ